MITAMTTPTVPQFDIFYKANKLGIDAHSKYYWVCRQIEGATPQPAQKMTCDELLWFVVKQKKLSQLVACYEAGAFGFHLHRRLTELGVVNCVV